jgi:hypothetical protein
MARVYRDRLHHLEYFIRDDLIDAHPAKRNAFRNTLIDVPLMHWYRISSLFLPR